MGDDAVSHAFELRAPAGITIAALLGRAAPEIRASGWSWVVVVDGRVAAVWSVDHGVQLLIPDRNLTAETIPRTIHFRYFVQIDPEWLHRRLAEGAPADRSALELEYRPIAQSAAEAENRRREREIADRLLTPECMRALVAVGAEIDLHNDRLLRFDLHGERWWASRADTMLSIRHGDGGEGASIRPAAFAEAWLVAATSAASRSAAGEVRFPPYAPFPAPELRPMGEWPPGVRRWTTQGEPVAQLAGQDAVDAFQLAYGRTIAEIVALMGPVAG